MFLIDILPERIDFNDIHSLSIQITSSPYSYSESAGKLSPIGDYFYDIDYSEWCLEIRNIGDAVVEENFSQFIYTGSKRREYEWGYTNCWKLIGGKYYYDSVFYTNDYGVLCDWNIDTDLKPSTALINWDPYDGISLGENVERLLMNEDLSENEKKKMINDFIYYITKEKRDKFYQDN